MRRFTLFMILLIAVSLDCTVLTKIHLWDLRISLSLCVLLCIGVTYGKLSGALAGLTAGFIMDVMFGPAFGFYALTNLLTGYVVGAIFSRGMREDPLLIGLLTVGIYLVREGIAAILALLLGAEIRNIFLLLIRYLLPSALLCGAACIPLYMVLRSFMTTGYMRRRRVGLD